MSDSLIGSRQIAIELWAIPQRRQRRRETHEAVVEDFGLLHVVVDGNSVDQFGDVEIIAH